MFTFEDYLRRVYDGADIIRFLDKIAETYDVLIFSWVIRDYFMGVDCCPRDLDVVVMMEGNEDMGKFLMPSLCHRNLLGGYKICVNNVVVDIWPLSQTWGIRKKRLRPTPENLVKTSFFNFSAVAYLYREEKFVFSKDFFRFIETRELDVVMEENPLPDLCIANSIYYSKKYGFRIAPRLAEWIVGHYDSDTDYEKIQIEHLGEVCHSNDEIKVFVDSELNLINYV